MRTLLSTVLILMLAGCAQAPSIQQGPDAEVTFDGLVRIDHSQFSNAWIDPDVDLTQYNKILAGGAEFEFRAVKNSTSASTARRNSESEFWISDKNKESLKEIVTTAFREELQKSEKFTMADGPGPDVLIIVGGLHDIVSRVPPDMIGRGETYLSSVGEATLILEARDSLSGETIYRAIDRRSAERAGGQMVVSNTVTSTSEVRRLAKRWASRLRVGLDSIHE
ncbi:MAG: DUF3313 family protein [Gammaproteobacteria bacterium]|nr:DUF3313 family protein [Gammaproteobacteria bacterium]